MQHIEEAGVHSGDSACVIPPHSLPADVIDEIKRQTREMARELNVRYIVEGSVQRRGERIRISAQLIDTETGSHVWADRFDRPDLFKVQDEVVRTIVGTLVGRVRVADAARSRRKPPATLAAYDCVLQGNALPWSDATGSAEAARLFEQAIEADPGYGYAYALLAMMRSREWQNDLSGSDAALDEAWRLANRAVELDGNESTCFSILSQICLLRRSFDAALQQHSREDPKNTAARMRNTQHKERENETRSTAEGNVEETADQKRNPD